MSCRRRLYLLLPVRRFHSGLLRQIRLWLAGPLKYAAGRSHLSSPGGLLGQVAADVLVRHRHMDRAERRDAVQGPLSVVRVADGVRLRVRLRLPAEGGVAREQEVDEGRQEPQLRVGLLDPQELARGIDLQE